MIAGYRVNPPQLPPRAPLYSSLCVENGSTPSSVPLGGVEERGNPQGHDRLGQLGSNIWHFTPLWGQG